MNRISCSAVALLIVPLCACALRGDPVAPVVRLTSKVEFYDAADEVSFRLRPSGGGVRVEDGRRRALAFVQLDADGLVVTGADRRRLAVIRELARGRGFRVEPNGGGGAVELRAERDGDLTLEDAAGDSLYELKKREYGFKVVLPDGTLHAKLRQRPRKSSLRTAAGDTYLWTRDPVPAELTAVLALDELRFEYATGLAVAILHWGVATRTVEE